MNLANKYIILIFVSVISNANAKSENTYLKYSPIRGCTFLAEKSVIGISDDPFSIGLFYFMKNTVKIYTLSHPITDEIKYVGKTKKTLDKRLVIHIQWANWTKKPCHRVNWIKSLLKENFKPKIELLDEVPESSWKSREKYWIKNFKTLGFNLVNGTKGGDGGDTISENPNREKIINKMSESGKRKYKNKKYYKRWYKSNSKRIGDVDYHKKLSVSQIESYKKNPNRIEQQRQSQIKRYKNPKERKKSSEQQKERMKNKELRNQTGNAVKKFYIENPDSRKLLGHPHIGINNYQWKGYVCLYNNNKELKFKFVNIARARDALKVSAKTVLNSIRYKRYFVRGKYKGCFFRYSKK